MCRSTRTTQVRCSERHEHVSTIHGDDSHTGVGDDAKDPKILAQSGLRAARSLKYNMRTHLAKHSVRQLGHRVNALSNSFYAFRAMVDSIRGSHVCKQGLGSADVGGCFVSADVLLAGLCMRRDSDKMRSWRDQQNN